MKKTTSELAQSIESSLEHIIALKIRERTTEEMHSVDKYNWLTSEIHNELLNAQSLQKQFKKQKLSVNSIENEGYIRAFVFLTGLIGTIEEAHHINGLVDDIKEAHKKKK